MPSEYLLSSVPNDYGKYLDFLEKLINKIPNWVVFAEQHGACFFGIFLIVLAVILVLFKGDKTVPIILTVAGLLSIAFYLIVDTGIINTTYVYTMKINKFTINNDLALTDTSPPLYRTNRMHDIEQDLYHIDLITVSPAKLKEGHSFKVIITENKIFTMADGSQKSSDLKFEPAIPFDGKPNGIYEIQKKESAGEEGIYEYIIVPAQSNIKNETVHSTKILLPISTAYAEDIIPQDFSLSIQTIRLAQTIHIYSDKQATDLLIEEKDETQSKIIYFEKSSDESKVRSAFAKANITYAVQKSKLAPPSNAVWIGIDVPVELAEKVGKALIEEGIGLQYFGFFESREANINVIQIGYSQKSNNNEIITYQKVSAFAQQLGAIQEAQQKSQIEFKQRNIQVQDIIKKQQLLK